MAYDEAISQLKSLSIIDAMPAYQSNMSGYLKQQIQLTQIAVEQQLVGYSEALKSSFSILDAEVDIDYKARREARKICPP